MKDIVDLLHSVGVGKEGYSIIGQGKIEQIMNAKPEDRRAISRKPRASLSLKTASRRSSANSAIPITI